MSGDNSDGITIIDITDPESPAYCFVFIDFLFEGEEEDSEWNVLIMTPLSSTQYVRAYYPEDDIDDLGLEQPVLDTLRPFESVPMITTDMLAEAWPDGYTWSNAQNLSGALLEPKASVHLLPSLVDLMFVPALRRALQTGETDYLDQLMWLPGNTTKVKETLRVHNPLSEIDIALLSKTIAIEVKQTKTVDFSHFPLTGEQMIELLSAQEDVEVLNLSHMQQITSDILRRLIPILPDLRHLVLLQTIPDDDVLSLLSDSPELFYRLESLIHFAFLRPFEEATFPAAFSHVITKHCPNKSEVTVASLPYFTPGQLVQGLTDYISILIATNNREFVSYDLPLLSTYASIVREPERSWSERIVPFIPRNYKAFEIPQGWFLAWSVPNSFSDRTSRYAFAKIDKEVMAEYNQRIDELRSLPNHPDRPQSSEDRATGGLDAKLEGNPGTDASFTLEELRALKEIAIKAEYANRQFHIFDVESFFQELVKEGRPAPSPEALGKLLGLFAELEKMDGPQQLCIMEQADLRSFLEVTQYNIQHRFYLL